ncbi:hypothetical protein WJX74_000164 [Apatococcus lobatus]|uniref:Protein kinase domain-containing protein n=2 Tax=Apatococcus TaxID=904362 RepID=A0AAW1TA96_9CHLO
MGACFSRQPRQPGTRSGAKQQEDLQVSASPDLASSKERAKHPAVSKAAAPPKAQQAAAATQHTPRSSVPTRSTSSHSPFIGNVSSAGPDEPSNLRERYRILRKLSKRSRSPVFEAVHRATKERVAIKLLARGPDCSTLLRGIENHLELSHPHIIDIKEVHLTPKYLGLVLEFAPGGDLFQYIQSHGSLTETETRRIFQQLIIALEYCHGKGIVNRDLKPENTLIMTRKGMPFVKLSDFGYSKMEAIETQLRTQVGTVGYTAPEILMGLNHSNEVDIWSAGVMLYVMLFGAYPFLEDSELMEERAKFTLTHQRVLAADYKLPADAHVSTDVADLLKGLLVVNPAHRLTIPAIMKHPWFREALPEKATLLNSRCWATSWSLHQDRSEVHDLLIQAQYSP